MGLWNSIKSAFMGNPVDANYYDRLLGLEPGETFVWSAGGKYVHGLEFEDKTVTMGKDFILVLTSQGRLIFGDMHEMKPENARVFDPVQTQVNVVGPLKNLRPSFLQTDSFRVAGPTGAMEDVHILRITPPDEEPFAIYVVESALPHFLELGAAEPRDRH